MLDCILKALGLVRQEELDRVKEAYQLDASRKFYRENMERADARNREFERKIDAGDVEAKARWTSPDGKRVLKDLQRALNHLRDYQRAMWVVLAPDNNYYLVKELLEAWGMEPYSEVDDTYARANRGIKKVDRTGQSYDSYGIAFLHGDDMDEVCTFEDIDPDDPNFKTTYDQKFGQARRSARVGNDVPQDVIDGNELARKRCKDEFDALPPLERRIHH